MEVTILGIAEGVRIDERGNLVRTRVVTYKIGEYGPFTIELPATEFSEITVREKIEQEKNRILGVLSIR
jgi:hypothetical protein